MIGPLDPSASAAFPLMGIVAFAIVIYASWRARRRPDAHKRLIHNSNCSSASSRSNQRACPLASIPTRTFSPARVR